MFIPGRRMTGFGDLDHVLADEILQPSGTTHPWREFRLERLTFNLPQFLLPLLFLFIEFPQMTLDHFIDVGTGRGGIADRQIV